MSAAQPKSMSVHSCTCGRHSTLAGLRSRCTVPAACMAARSCMRSLSTCHTAMKEGRTCVAHASSASPLCIHHMHALLHDLETSMGKLCVHVTCALCPFRMRARL